MKPKFYRSYGLLTTLASRWSRRIIGLILFASLGLVAVASLPVLSQTQPDPQPSELVRQGKEFYEAGKLDLAIQTWQQATAAYRAQDDPVNTRESAINTATAQQALGLYSQSCQSLLLAFNLSEETDCTQILARAQAVESELETDSLFRSDDEIELISALQPIVAESNSTDKAVGLLRFGDYLRESGYAKVAVDTLKLSLKTAAELNEPTQQTAALLSLGNTARAIAENRQNRFPPQTIALDIVANQDGSSASALEPYQPAFNYYQRTAATATSPIDTVKAELNHLSMLIDVWEFWQQATTELQSDINDLDITDREFLNRIQNGAVELNYELARDLQPQILALTQKLEGQIASLPTTRGGIYSKINFAQSLIRQGRTNEETAEILASAIAEAHQLDNVTAEAEAMGYLGYLYEQQQQYPEARRLTEASLQLAPTTEYPEIAYRWNAQLGKILALQGETDKALTAYEASFNTIRALRSDLATTPVEPIFRDYISLLLEKEPTPAQLQQARDVLESLQVVKLDNFFRDPCSEVAEEPVIIDDVDPEAAVIYPIVLPDRLEVILTLPGKPLQRYSTNVSSQQVEATIKQLRRRSLTNPGFAEAVRSARGNEEPEPQIQKIQQTVEQSIEEDILPLSTEIYSWLIEPVEAQLEASKVKTLVFVLDDSLRNIPMSILYDPQDGKYLIEKDYNVALSSGLQLTNPQPLERQEIRVLAAGVTREYPEYRFPPIPKVKDELEEIQAIFGNSEILLNQEFTQDTLQQKLQESYYPVVHLATHGQFSSTSDQTFILSGAESGSPLINVNQLDNLL